MSGPIRIRAAIATDSPALARLSAQLGYPADAAMCERRLREIAARGAGVVFVAEAGDGMIAGAAHVMAECSLVDDSKGHLADLIVDESCRGRGTGAALLRASEAWARERGLARMRVNSNVIRERAHRFYLREGYAEHKRQAVFFKQLV